MTRSRDTDLSPSGSREVDDLNQVFNATRVKRPLRATSCCAGPIRPGLMLTKTNLGRRLRGRGNFWHMRIHSSFSLLLVPGGDFEMGERSIHGVLRSVPAWNPH